jgi:Spy/CpxP family protein refolding chaperone
MARIPRWLLVMVALVLTAGMLAAAQAQPPGPPPGGGPGAGGGRGFGMMGGGSGGMLRLLEDKAVQTELKLGEEQINQLKDIREDMRKMRESSERPNRERFAEIEKQVKDVLEPEQLKRLEQIQLQLRLKMMAWRSFAEDDLAGKLGITDDQKEKLKKISDDLGAKMREVFPRPEGGQPPRMTDEQRTAGMAKMQELSKAAYEEAIKVLTPEQKEKLDALTGKEVKVDTQALMGGMRGGPRGDRGDRGPRNEGRRRGPDAPAN